GGDVQALAPDRPRAPAVDTDLALVEGPPLGAEQHLGLPGADPQEAREPLAGDLQAGQGAARRGAGERRRGGLARGELLLALELGVEIAGLAEQRLEGRL